MIKVRLIKTLIASVLICRTFCLQSAEPLAIQHKDVLSQTLESTKLAVFFYGLADSHQYDVYEKVIPQIGQKELFAQLRFYFIPADKFHLNKPVPSFEIFRYINQNEWLTYDGPYDVKMMGDWIRRNCHDQLLEMTPQNMDQLFAQGTKGMVLLDYGQFQLLRTKILIADICLKKQVLCRKVTVDNALLGSMVKLMRAQDQPGVPKLARYDPDTQKFQLFVQKEIYLMTEQDIIEFLIGKEGIVPSDFSRQIIDENDDSNTQL